MDVDTEQPRSWCRVVAGLGGLPRVMATAASVVIVVLAIAGGGSYESELAVLTATAVAVVWYAYWTFRVARPPARVVLRINPDLDRPHHSALHPEVENPTDRPLYAQLVVRVWIDGEPVGLGPFYRGDRTVSLPGHRSVRGFVPLKEHLAWTEKEGHTPDTIASRELLVSMQATWTDPLCERGEHAALHWHVDLGTRTTTAVADPERINEIFGPLPNPYAPDQAGPA